MPLSVVILNWRRPERVERFVNDYCGMGCVDEVVMVDCSGMRPKPRHDAKLRVVTYSHDPGLYARFAHAALCRNDGVMLVDDDIEVPEATVKALYLAALPTLERVHGLFGRNPYPDGAYAAGHTVYGEVEVVLTRCLITDRRTIAAALPYCVEADRQGLAGEPRGNGEDIILSYAAMRHSEHLNQAYGLPYRNHGYDDRHAISVRYAGHEAHRTQVVRWCRSRVLGRALLDPRPL